MTDSRWKIKQLLFWHLIIALLLTSFFWPVSAIYWKKLDVAFFKWINGSLRDSPGSQLFWALANHRLADWLEDVFILGFFTLYIRSVQKELRLKKIATLIFCALYIAAIIFFVNGKLFRKSLIFPRESPTMVVSDSIRLSEHISWLKVKDDSTKCFPGDHGTTAILFASCYYFLAGWRLGLIAVVYGAFLCLPRMIVGAHWLSDVVVGSGCLTAFFLSWAFCTPFGNYWSQEIEDGLKNSWKRLQILIAWTRRPQKESH
jgi:membrane-associated phospholipid phosphatase